MNRMHHWLLFFFFFLATFIKLLYFINTHDQHLNVDILRGMCPQDGARVVGMWQHEEQIRIMQCRGALAHLVNSALQKRSQILFAIQEMIYGLPSGSNDIMLYSLTVTKVPSLRVCEAYVPQELVRCWNPKQKRTTTHQKIVANCTNKRTKGRKPGHTNLMRFGNCLHPRGRRRERSY